MPVPRSVRLRVGFDATSLLGQRTGIGHVSAAMLERIAADPAIEARPFALTWRGRQGLGDLVPAGVEASTRPFPARLARVLWPRVGWPNAEFFTGPVDVVHAPNFVAPPARAPVVVTIHDLVFHHFPELCTADVRTYGSHIRRAIDSGAVVHTVSDFVADEVCAVFDLPRDRVVRIYTGPLPIPSGEARRGQAITGRDRYVLAIGTIEPRKNLPQLVAAFDAVAADRPDLSLVVAGPDGWGSEAFRTAVEAARHRDRIVRLGYVESAARADLLAGATLLAYPSIYEGFGHPPLEAMSAGVPVVASNAGALPESLGDAALLPDPNDDDAIAEAMARVLDDETLRTALVARGRRQAKRYSWDDTAKQLTDLYRRVASA